MSQNELRSPEIIVRDAVASEGWNDQTLIELLLTYIENQDNNDTFADFIEERKS